MGEMLPQVEVIPERGEGVGRLQTPYYNGPC